jgi:hypothetical protein
MNRRKTERYIEGIIPYIRLGQQLEEIVGIGQKTAIRIFTRILQAEVEHRKACYMEDKAYRDGAGSELPKPFRRTTNHIYNLVDKNRFYSDLLDSGFTEFGVDKLVEKPVNYSIAYIHAFGQRYELIEQDADDS